MSLLPFVPTLEVDLGALVRNYTLLASRHQHKSCAAVVKANAYGLGVARVAPALADAGCHTFFVATLEEGIELRKLLPETAIYVFHGCRRAEMKALVAHKLIPVLNDAGQVKAWNGAHPFAIHIDTGMCRLGVTLEEFIHLQPATGNLQLLLSHLACANEPDHPKNAEQLKAFRMARQHRPSVPGSLANSSGVFLGPDYHFDLLRPGCSLYGISPNTQRQNPMENVVTLSAPVLQIRTLEKSQSVGYGALGFAEKGTILATVELGYADGFQRRLTNHAFGYAFGHRLPVVGRVSMDMVSVDITRLPEPQRTPDLRITFIGKDQPVDELAQAAGTIGYELFTGLGKRVKRLYRQA